MAREILSICWVALLALSLQAAEGAFGTWWWDGRGLGDEKTVASKLDFLSSQGVTEIYLCVHWQSPTADLVRFVRAAKAKGMSVACLSGDVSWIRPGNLGFDEIFSRFRKYQKSAPEDARFTALHLDVEPHQDDQLSKERKWQLYADFVLRATALVHKAGEKIEWDIPFWLDDFKVAYGASEATPLLEVIMDHSDGVTLMSYRDTAEAILGCGKTELEMGKTRNCRVLLGAETGQTGEGDFVSFYEEGKARMARELAKVRAAAAKAGVPAGTGVAVHHVGSWLKLKD